MIRFVVDGLGGVVTVGVGVGHGVSVGVGLLRQ